MPQPDLRIDIKKDWTNDASRVSLKRGYRLLAEANAQRPAKPSRRAGTESSLDIIGMPECSIRAGKRSRAVESSDEDRPSRSCVAGCVGEWSPGEGPSERTYIARHAGKAPIAGSQDSRLELGQRQGRQAESEGWSESEAVYPECDEPTVSSQEGPLRRSGRRRPSVDYAESPAPGDQLTSGRADFSGPSIPLIDLTGEDPSHPEASIPVIDLTRDVPAREREGRLGKKAANKENPRKRAAEKKKLERRETKEERLEKREAKKERNRQETARAEELRMAVVGARPDIAFLIQIYRSGSFDCPEKHAFAPYAFQQDGTLTKAYREIFASHQRAMRETGKTVAAEHGSDFFDSGLGSLTPRSVESQEPESEGSSTPIVAALGNTASSLTAGTGRARPSAAAREPASFSTSASATVRAGDAGSSPATARGGSGALAPVSSSASTTACAREAGSSSAADRGRAEGPPSAGPRGGVQGTTVVGREEASSSMARRRASNPRPAAAGEAATSRARPGRSGSATRNPEATAQRSSSGAALVLRNRGAAVDSQEYAPSSSGGLLYHVDYQMTSNDAEYQARWRAGPMRGGRSSRGTRDGGR